MYMNYATVIFANNTAYQLYTRFVKLLRKNLQTPGLMFLLTFETGASAKASRDVFHLPFSYHAIALLVLTCTELFVALCSC